MTATTTTIEPWNEAREGDIARFVDDHAEGLVYYKPAFRRYLLAMLDARCRSQIAVADGRVAGVLPLIERDGPFGRVLNSLPFFGSNGGALAADLEAAAALTTAFETAAAGPGIAAATWISHPFLEQPVPAHTIEDERIAQWTELEAGSDPLALIASSARRNVAKAEREGVRVRETADGLGFLEDVHRENMAAIGGRAKPTAFFSTLPAAMAYGRDWRLYVAERGGEPLAALLTFEAAATVEYVMPAVKEQARELQPTAAILAHAMRDAARRGMRRWNWGGTWLTQEGVYRFKRKWGARERRYKYHIAVANRELLAASPAELLSAYPYFFTVPFHLLKPKEAA